MRNFQKLHFINFDLYEQKNSIKIAALRFKFKNIADLILELLNVLPVFLFFILSHYVQRATIGDLSSRPPPQASLANTQELQNKLREKFLDNLNETIAFNRKKYFEKYLEIKVYINLIITLLTFFNGETF
ncbi:hypothetical protein BpHYR1_031072 [Brachionus plicatilis]|uniref:Uncharacterized protein n=1 Tax=Brachionus plicatilis TaxID=10195 RepID=A0A3M7RXY4_BRAPC|nr:hypothetical protein BpHYR1_031072 [Brachionus plicatilis]